MDDLDRFEAGLDQQWCCLACRSKFRFGAVKMVQDKDDSKPVLLGCPVCGRSCVTPADGSTYTISNYVVVGETMH